MLTYAVLVDFSVGKKGHFEDPSSILYQKKLYWDADLRPDPKSLLCVEVGFYFFLVVPTCCRLWQSWLPFQSINVLFMPAVELKVSFITTRGLIILIEGI